MFNRTKREIIFTVVAALLVLMIITLSTIFISNRIETGRQNEEMLKEYVSSYSLEGQPEKRDDAEQPGDGEKPPEPPDEKRPMKNEPLFRLSTFYSVAYSKSGEVLSVDNGNNELQSETSLLELTASVLESGKTEGSTGDLLFLVDEREDFTLVAMIDGTITNNSRQMLIREMLIIGVAATLILFIISIFTAKRIVRPLEENDKKQKRFVSDASHELKTPIAVISANSELLRRQTGENEWLSNIDYENEKMGELVRQLLILSKSENDGGLKEDVDFSNLVVGELLPFESLAFEKGKTIESEIESDLFVEGDTGRLRQLVSILLDNALSHGTGDLISLELRREKHSAVLRVSNDADVMSEDTLSSLFDRFYRVGEAREDSGAHYGLGLSIAKAVTETHGGGIKAEYIDGKAVFTVSLPIKKH